MGRILKAYESRFRSMLKQAGARRPEQGADWLVAKAHRLSASQKLPLSTTLTRVYHTLQRQCLSHSAGQPKAVESDREQTFWCDSGLGGLARWLRAAGYDALWHKRINDDELLGQARSTGRIILTTDSIFMERRLLRDRIVPALWLPPILSIPDQLAMVISEFRLRLRQPRCMSCGGELRPVNKESVRERIPPKTLLWLDEYYLCSQCDRLFWRGTHWQRIQHDLQRLFATVPSNRAENPPAERCGPHEPHNNW